MKAINFHIRNEEILLFLIFKCLVHALYIYIEWMFLYHYVAHSLFYNFLSFTNEKFLTVIQIKMLDQGDINYLVCTCQMVKFNSSDRADKPLGTQQDKG